MANRGEGIPKLHALVHARANVACAALHGSGQAQRKVAPFAVRSGGIQVTMGAFGRKVKVLLSRCFD